MCQFNLSRQWTSSVKTVLKLQKKEKRTFIIIIIIKYLVKLCTPYKHNLTSLTSRY